MERLARHPAVIAIGEIGLDYHYDHSPRDVQQRVFRQQLELAAAVKLPILIHCRPSQDSTNAWDDLLAILREQWRPTGLGGVMHCFTGNLAQAHASLDLGFILSFAGNISYPKAQNIRDAAAIVPLDRFFLETDCPYLAPIPHRGKRNEPAFVVETARHFAQLRNLTPEAAGSLALEEFLRVLPPAPCSHVTSLPTSAAPRPATGGRRLARTRCQAARRVPGCKARLQISRAVRSHSACERRLGRHRPHTTS